MPGGLSTLRTGLAVVAGLAGLVLAAAAAADPYADYRAAHPEVLEEDLLEVHAGDALDRVLAVLHHPAAGFDPLAFSAVRADRPGSEAMLLSDALAAGADLPELVVSVRQRCTPADASAGSSWFLIEAAGLRAWSLQPFGTDCRTEDALAEASDHGALRRVGEKLFSRARRGSFRYGALIYEEWSEAFASPTPEGMLSRLQAAALARPHDAHAQNRLAVGLHARAETKAARAALERAVRLAPSWPRPHANLAVLHRLAGDLVAAREARERAEWLAMPAAADEQP